MATDRRTFLKLLGAPAMAAALPANVAKLLAMPAQGRTGTIADVEHIVILMQENRSFDHYFGTMRGVRGFADPRVMKLPSGQPVWRQPNGAGYVLPFRPPVEDVGMTFLSDPPHGWIDGHNAWNNGKYDQWIANKGITAMTYHLRHDLPYHRALADAFTLCDAYHCSMMGPTDPNRYHMFSGWAGNNGSGGPDGNPITGEGPVVTNAELGYGWSTYPERLERNGISWKVYQDTGVGLTADGFWGWTGDPFIGNYGDNSLLYFKQYQNAPEGSPLARRARTGTTVKNLNREPERLFDIFREDVRTGKLPQVSFIIAPEAYTEHPNWAPNWGAWYISQFVDVLVETPDLWSKTALLINYDEEGGFFDHMVPPTPPMTAAHGASTVSTVNEVFPGATRPNGTFFQPGPYGLGERVPMIVVSPWSKGGFVNSQLFDHTSVIKFLEARFGQGNSDLYETNITPWRCAVVGDLTTAFDFDKPERWRDIDLLSTDEFLPDLQGRPDFHLEVPGQQSMPGQEKGVRPARALPYDLATSGLVVGSNFRIDFNNTGDQAAVFHARSGNPSDLPRCYTVEPGLSLTGVWPAANNAYDLSVHGPNGFFRSYKGGVANANAKLQVRAQGSHGRLDVAVTNQSGQVMTVRLFNRYTGKTADQRLNRGETMSRTFELNPFNGWYECVVTVLEDGLLECRLAGHLEDGKDSFSDPLMGGLV